MLKYTLAALILTATAFASTAVEARGGHGGGHHGYSHHYGGHGYGRHSYGGHGYGGHGYGGHSYGGHRSYRHRGHSSHNGAYLVGGLVLGSVLTNAWHRNNYDYYDNSYRTVTRTVYVEPRTRVVERSAPTGRRLYRDRDGNCFERVINSAGDEILAELPVEDCAW